MSDSGSKREAPRRETGVARKGESHGADRQSPTPDSPSTSEPTDDEDVKLVDILRDYAKHLRIDGMTALAGHVHRAADRIEALSTRLSGSEMAIDSGADRALAPSRFASSQSTLSRP